jgi:protein SCO1/2
VAPQRFTGQARVALLRARRALRAGGAGLLAAALALGCLFTQPAAAQPAPLQGLQLQDHRGRPLAAAQLAGRPVLLHFVFAGCSRVCPLQLQELRQLHEALPPAVRARVVFLSATVDPLSDTPQALATFAQRQGVDRPGWHFLSGAPAQVQRLLDRMQVFDPRAAPPQPEDHRNAIYLYTPSGQLLQRFRGEPVDRARLADELGRLAQPAPHPTPPRPARSPA